MSPERRVGNVDLWTHVQAAGWRSTNTAIGVSQTDAIRYSQELPQAVSLIVWHWNELPGMQVFYYYGREIYPGTVIELQELEDEVQKLQSRVWQEQSSRESDQQIESVAAEVLLEQAKKRRDEFLDQLKKEKA